MSLGFTLLLTALLLVTVLTMAAVATTTLNLSTGRARGLEAGYLAEAAAMQALARIHADTAFGTKDEEVRYQPDRNDGTRYALVTFAPTAKVPYSTNNLDGSRSTGYGGAAVPAGSIRLLATGWAGGEERTVEVYARVPRFPYVLSVREDLAAGGSLEVRAASSMADFVDQESGTASASQGLPASVAAGASVTLGGVSQVSGDVVCSGKVQIAEGSTVGGMVRPGPVDLPSLTTAQFTPSGASVEELDPVYDDARVEFEKGRFLSRGSVEFVGDVVLEDTLLFVKGDLTVGGSISGTGAVVVEGNATVKRGADLTASGLVALVTSGDVTLTGDAGRPSYYQGLVVAGGRFTASRITIAGAFVSGGLELGGSSPGDMDLQDVSAVYVPEATSMILDFSQQPPTTMMGRLPNYYGGGLDAGRSRFSLPWDNNYAGAVTQGGFTVDGYGTFHFNPRMVDVEVPYYGDRVVDAVLKDMEISSEGGKHASVSKVQPKGGAPYYLRAVDVGSDKSFKKVTNPGATFIDLVHVYVEPVRSEDYVSFDGGGLLVAQVPSLYLNPETGRYEMKDPTVTFQVRPNGTMFVVEAGRDEAEKVAGISGTTVDEMIAFSLDRQKEAMEMANQVLDGKVPMTTESQVVDLDLNRFLSDATPVRVTSWRDW